MVSLNINQNNIENSADFVYHLALLPGDKPPIIYEQTRT